MSILVCGASGMVGRDLCELFDRENIQYYGTYYNCNQCAFCQRENMFRVDFTNPNEVGDFFFENKHRWSVCIFLVGERNIEKCENDWNATKQINVDAVDNMSALCAKEGIYFIYLSSDYVFDGTSHQPYFPSSQVNPLQNYGISKLMAEYRVQKNYIPKVCLSSRLSFVGVTVPNYCIIRTPVLYTDNSCTLMYNNSIMSIAKSIMDFRYTKAIAPFVPTTTTPITKYEDDYYIYRPVYIPDLCIFIRVVAVIAMDSTALKNDTCVNRKISTNCGETPKFSGIYHFYNPDNVFTKYQIIKEFSKYMELPQWHIVPHRPLPKSPDYAYTIEPVKNPYDTQLMDARYNIRSFFTHTFSETIPFMFSRYKHPRLDIRHKNSCIHLPASINNNTYFIIFDLDGTLVHTSYAHYRSYLDVFRNRGLEFITYNEWTAYTNYNHLRCYLENVAYELSKHDIHRMEQILSDIQNEKLEAFRIHAALYITPTKNASEMLKYIDANPGKITAVIVTHNNTETVDIIREIVPQLNKITKWCICEPFELHKPDTDVYSKAKEMYYNNEKYIIGIENTHIGYDSVRKTTPIVYLYIDENDEYAKRTKWYNKADAFIFDDYLTM